MYESRREARRARREHGGGRIKRGWNGEYYVTVKDSDGNTAHVYDNAGFLDGDESGTAEIGFWDYNGTFAQYQLDYPEFAGMTRSGARKLWEKKYGNEFRSYTANEAQAERNRIAVEKMRMFALGMQTSGTMGMGALGSSVATPRQFNYLPKASSQGFKYAPRVRARGVQDPKSHNFPYSFDDAILSTKPIIKNNGYRIFQLKGTMNGKQGVYEIGVTKNGVIDHRFFRPF